jgi:hypothetical protein
MLKFKKGGYTRHDSGTVYKVKDIFPNKNHDCSELLYTDKEHEAKVFMYIDGIRGVLSYMKLVKNAGVTLPDYYIVTNGVKEEVAKIHF